MQNCLRTITKRPKTETRTSHDHRLPVQFGCTFTFWQLQHRHAQKQVKPHESSANKKNGKHIQKNKAITAIIACEIARFPLDWNRKTCCWSQSRPLAHSNNNTTVLMLLFTSHWNYIWTLKLFVTVWGKMCSLSMQNSLPHCYAVAKWLL